MLSQKQLEIKYLIFLINARLLGQVLQEADPEMKSSTQEVLGVNSAEGREGKGGAGLGKSRSWSVVFSQQRPQRTSRGAEGLA